MPSESPFGFDVDATYLTYKHDGEVQYATQRWWNMWEQDGVENYQVQNAVTLKIREFRGQGRARTMTRLRDTSGAPYEAIDATAVWTDYDGDMPWSDYKVTSCVDSATIENVRHYELGTAELDYGPPSGGDQPIEAVDYVHADHLGTTRGRTNDPLPPGGSGAMITARPVYTAFGVSAHEHHCEWGPATVLGGGFAGGIACGRRGRGVR